MATDDKVGPCHPRAPLKFGILRNVLFGRDVGDCPLEVLPAALGAVPDVRGAQLDLLFGGHVSVSFVRDDPGVVGVVSRLDRRERDDRQQPGEEDRV